MIRFGEATGSDVSRMLNPKGRRQTVDYVVLCHCMVFPGVIRNTLASNIRINL